MSSEPNIFNIPANYHFFESLFCWFEENFAANPAEVKIFLPNQRSCREFKKFFLHKKQVAILPKIKAISDLSYEDCFDFLPNDEVKQAIDELLQIKVISGIDYLFLLSHEIQKLSIFGQNDFDQTFKIALRLKDLFNEIEHEEIDLKKLDEIDDSDLSKHRQITLDFLKNFYTQIKNSLLKKNISFESSNQNLIVTKFTQLLAKHGSKAPIIIAGSTGTISSSKKLIREISRQKNGHVVLYGLAISEENFEEENHPQFFLNQLLKFLEVEKKAVKNLNKEKFILSDESRQRLLSLMMMPAEKSLAWQKADVHLDVKKITADLEKNFQLLEVKSEIEEAQNIVSLLHNNFLQEKKSAFISNNQKLVSLVELELNALALPFNNSNNLGVLNSRLVQFLLLILELFESDFNSATLLALLKNPLCRFAKDGEILTNFEIKILRQERVRPGLEGIEEKLKNSGEIKLQSFFKEIYRDLSALNNATDLISYTADLILAAENLSGKTWQKLLAEEPAQIELFEFFEKLKSQQDFYINQKNSLSLFKNLFSQISYFEKSDKKSDLIHLLPTVEARLLNYDFVIVASLNEGDFPQIESDDWLGRKIKRDLGIEKNLKRIGQSAYDFCNYLSNSHVTLSRCRAKNNATIIESPFLLRLKTVCEKIGVKISTVSPNLSYAHTASATNSAPNPKPDLEFRPQKISITEISKLIANPYEIYAKKILQLRELEKIDFEKSYAEFGSFIHKALEEFVKNPHDKNFIEKADKIFAEFFIADSAKLIWWPKFENIFNDFLLENEQFSKCENYLEIPVKLQLGENLISGKIDRIIFDEKGFAQIFDYKTGQLPSTKNVISGIDPQLTIAALAMAEGIIENKLKNISEEKISSINYWKLSSSSASEIKKICGDNEEIQILIAAAKSGLARLFAYFADEKNGYAAIDNDKKSEYQNLVRAQEWNR